MAIGSDIVKPSKNLGMTPGFGESTSRDTQDSSSISSDNSCNNDGAGSFECNICFELAQDPIVTLCGHLYCWPCLYKWLHIHSHSQECPVCKALIEEEKLVPLYGRGKTPADPRSKSVSGIQIPNRPTGQRPGTAPSPDLNHFVHHNLWQMDGFPVGGTRFGSYTIFTTIGGLFPYLNLPVHGIPDTTAGFHYGHGNTFQGGNAQGIDHHHPSQGQDSYMKTLLFVMGSLVVATLLLF